MAPATTAAHGPYGFLGPEGSFAHVAAQALAGDAELAPHASVVEAVDAVRAGTVLGAVVPLENSVEGSVPATLDELAELAGGSPLVIAAETYLPVVFDLLARPGTRPADISAVATHPHAAAQVRRYLLTQLPAAKVIPVDSTAGGAQAVADGRYDAAVAPAAAGQRYGLDSLAHDIADNPGAVTRFVLLRRAAEPPPPTGNDRTTVVAYPQDDHVGALLEILTEFATRGVNLTRIESRPTKGRLGQYCFSIDCEGHVREARVGDALAALRRICADVRYLGSYPRRDGRLGEVLSGRADEDFRQAAGWLDRIRGAGTG
ncbi:MAG TPA: prephenate dehydratase [Jatrophihabitans sp.]|uniref:prephenate dehydratase n=1 Tax=Jatrophihabitans sp. TaxID=1932789 RepID=UPI002EFD1E81